MVSVQTPDWVKEHLSDGEDVISRFSTGIVSYYASDRRVLRFSRKSECDSLPYDQLSITYKSHLSFYVAASLVILVCALCVIAFSILTFVGPDVKSGGTVTITKAPLGFSCGICFAGLWTLAVPVVLPFGYYQFTSPDLDSQALKKFRIGQDLLSGRKLEKFVEAIEQKSGRSILAER